MSEKHAPPVAGVLDSVRQLEAALESGSTTRAASEGRLSEARAEASRLLAAARNDAVAEVAERRRVVLAAADEDAAEILRLGAKSAEQVRANARISCATVVEAALALVVPADGEGEG